jgi:hypothetical protein
LEFDEKIFTEILSKIGPDLVRKQGDTISTRQKGGAEGEKEGK